MKSSAYLSWNPDRMNMSYPLRPKERGKSRDKRQGLSKIPDSSVIEGDPNCLYPAG
jgi:hypothetical protein